MTRLKRLISEALDAEGFDDLDTYVANGRAEGLSWRLLADLVAVDSGWDCSHVNLTNWYDNDGKARERSPRAKA